MKKESFFIKHMAISKKLEMSSKANLIVILQIEKKAEKKNTKGGFQCFQAPVILNDSIYRKDEKYYPKVFLGSITLLNKQKFIVVILRKKNYDEECINLFLETLKK